MYEQMHPYFDTLLSKRQCGYRQGYSTQHCLLVMTEKQKEGLNNGGQNGALMTDLS